MRIKFVCLLSLVCWTITGMAQERNTSEFIPGEQEIFIDSLKGERPGEFPSRWGLQSGTAEIMTFEHHPLIGFTASQTEIYPLFKKTDYLPEQFTLELEVYFHNLGNEGYTLFFNGRKFNFRINRDGIKTATDYVRRPQETLSGWRKVEVSFNQRALKIYYQGERLVNIPQLPERPTRLSLQALSHGARTQKYAMVRNIRIAKGGVPLYDRLIADGKLEVNAIHFDYNTATLQSASLPVIERLADMLRTHAEVRLGIEGHTDSDGEADFNQQLSEKRAEAVRDALTARQIPADRLTTKGWGESRPIADNDSPEGKALNRRVTFLLL